MDHDGWWAWPVDRPVGSGQRPVDLGAAKKARARVWAQGSSVPRRTTSTFRDLGSAAGPVILGPGTALAVVPEYERSTSA